MNWPSFDLLPNVVRGVKWGTAISPQPLATQFPNSPSDAIDLLDKIMQLDPKNRLSAASCLEHPYFLNDPQMVKEKDLPIPGLNVTI